MQKKSRTIVRLRVRIIINWGLNHSLIILPLKGIPFSLIIYT